MTDITFADIARKTIEIVNERPNFNYQEFRKKQLNKPADYRWHEIACVYFDGDNEPSCLFGHVFAALEIGYNRSWENTGITDLIQDTLNIECTMPQRNWLNSLQSSQDQGYSWGAALDNANELYPEVTEAL